ncbi:MAG TPA: NAD(P)-dependent oxidoreductase, partial [Rubrobacter sp.]|nr:NAD(P)-dependent oxidoreductase [Rubrobacter sp.]
MSLYETDDARAGRRRRVLLTGATGYIAGQLLPAFRERYDLRLIDVRETDASGNGVEGIEAFDLLSDEDSTLEPLFSDVEVVVHCGHFKPEGDDPETLYRGERRNVDMMHRVYRLALEQGVERVVAAST